MYLLVEDFIGFLYFCFLCCASCSQCIFYHVYFVFLFCFLFFLACENCGFGILLFLRLLSIILASLISNSLFWITVDCHSLIHWSNHCKRTNNPYFKSRLIITLNVLVIFHIKNKLEYSQPYSFDKYRFPGFIDKLFFR